MLEVRRGFFETNSSSCHALIIPRDQYFKVSKVVDLSEDSDRGDIFRKFIREELNDLGAKALITLLYSSGVEEIKYYGRNEYITKYIEEYKGTTEFLGLPPYSPNADFGEEWNKEDWLRFIFGEDNWLYDGHDSDLEEMLDDSVCWFIDSQ